jgi:hypothetical protein
MRSLYLSVLLGAMSLGLLGALPQRARADHWWWYEPHCDHYYYPAPSLYYTPSYGYSSYGYWAPRYGYSRGYSPFYYSPGYAPFYAPPAYRYRAWPY